MSISPPPRLVNAAPYIPFKGTLKFPLKALLGCRPQLSASSGARPPGSRPGEGQGPPVSGRRRQTPNTMCIYTYMHTYIHTCIHIHICYVDIEIDTDIDVDRDIDLDKIDRQVDR